MTKELKPPLVCFSLTWEKLGEIERLVFVYKNQDGWSKNEARAILGDIFADLLTTQGVFDD